LIRTLTIAALLLATTAPLAAQAPVPPLRPEIATVVPTIEAHFRRFMADQHVPGLVYGLVRDGRLVYSHGLGVREPGGQAADSETLFRIASMSKAFTALAILKLRDEGRLTLDALAETYVPEMRNWHYPTTDSPRIRVRDLLSHAAGFVTDDPWGDRQQILPEADFTRMLQGGVPFTRAPQIAFEYSNFGYALLGRIVTNVSGRPYKDYIEHEIMHPLGMASTGYDIAASPRDRRAIGYRWENDAYAREPDMAHGTFGAMGGVQTSVSDYARWVAFLLSAWPARDGPEQGPVRRSSVRELAAGLNLPQVTRRPGAGPDSCPQAATYGMGMRVAVDCELGLTLAHGGGYPGYGSYVLLLPEHGIGVFAFANRTYAGPSPPVWAAALELERAGWLVDRPLAVSAALAGAYAGAREMWQAGSIEPGSALLAMNFRMDRSAENWALEFARLKALAGSCDSRAGITATGALAGRFAWTCERGTLQGQLLLAPTNPPTIQALRFNFVPPR
jgi:serine-type D-Ala-D-Ala carboxypeptidase/endopeptidase